MYKELKDEYIVVCIFKDNRGKITYINASQSRVCNMREEGQKQAVSPTRETITVSLRKVSSEDILIILHTEHKGLPLCSAVFIVLVYYSL